MTRTDRRARPGERRARGAGRRASVLAVLVALAVLSAVTNVTGSSKL
ncbi:hypothetical protein ACIBSR_28130 [Streptomyces sp. NPDC049936]